MPHRAPPCPTLPGAVPSTPKRPSTSSFTWWNRSWKSGHLWTDCPFLQTIHTFHHISSHHISLTEAKTAITIDNFDVPCDFTNTDAHTDRDTRGNSKLNTSQPRHINRTKSGRVVHSFQNRPSSIDSVTRNHQVWSFSVLNIIEPSS